MADIVFSKSNTRDDGLEGTQRLTSGDTITVRAGVTLRDEVAVVRGTAPAGSGVLRDVEVNLQGRIATFGDGVALAVDDGRVEGARIALGGDGFLGGVAHGLRLGEGRGNELVNRGIVTGTEAAVRSDGDLTIYNPGHIGTMGDSFVTSGRYHAVLITDGTGRIVNEGIVSGVNMGLSSWRQATIKANEDGRIDLVNREDGLVISEPFGANPGFDAAVMGGSAADSVVNHGTVTGTIELRDGDDVLVNHGGLFGGADLGDGDDEVTLADKSSFTGQLDLGDGKDVVRIGNMAVFAGAVDGGSGNDVYVLDAGVDVRIEERPGGGWDTVRSKGDHEAGAGIEAVYLLGADAGGTGRSARGNALDNLLLGNERGNFLFGNEGDDRVKGKAGDDRLSGAVGDDRLGGGGGDDVLFGGAGDDRLRGGDGDDRLVGGAGDDRLHGGDGADVFQWKEASAGERDKVRAFERGEDRLDLAALDLTLRPDGPTGARGDLWVLEKGDRAVLRIDLDGDAESDMRVILRGVTAIDSDDLTL